MLFDLVRIEWTWFIEKYWLVSLNAKIALKIPNISYLGILFYHDSAKFVQSNRAEFFC